jgi:hypothetical protein
VSGLPHWQQLLSDRGILQPALAAGWEPDGAGWKYPVAHGIWRWKAFDSKAQKKYLWIPKDAPDKPLYYLLPDFDASSGLVYIAAGEADTLAYHAAGYMNALCWFNGETSIPDSIASDLLAMGAQQVVYYHDLDATGERSALALAEKLHSSGLELFIGKLPVDLVGEKGDINKLWMASGFDASAFAGHLAECGWEDVSDLKPFSEQPQHELPYADLPDDFYAAVERALHVEGYKSDGWSKPIACVLKHHEHDAERPAAAWHGMKHIYSCLKCGVTDLLAKDIGETLGIDWRDYLPKKQKPEPKRESSNGKPGGIISWDEATHRAVDEILGLVDGSAFEPLPIPFHNIASFGGFAARIRPRKCMVIIGDSGDGKTSLSETIIDYWRRQGFSGCIWGSEWSETEYVHRAIQRQGGPSYSRIDEHLAWYVAKQRGVPEAKRPGKPLDEAEEASAIGLAETIRCWPGHLWFADHVKDTDDLLTRFAEIVDGCVAYGEHIAFAVWDYAQLLEPGEGVTRALQAFKMFCMDRDLVGLVTSQVPKASGKAMSQGDKLSAHDIQNGRSDVFNLALTINRELDEQGEKSPNATIRISKNNSGRTGQTMLQLNGKKLMWFDMNKDTT